MKNNLENLCQGIRRTIIELLYEKQVCHLGSDLSVVEILATLYFKVLKPEDHFVCSEGHVAAALYTVLMEKGFFTRAELFKNYVSDGKRFLNLVSCDVPGVEVSTGALGHGLPIAEGMALAQKLQGKPGRVFCLISDGELDCGSTWETILSAPHHQLDNLVLVVNNNRLQATGWKKDILNVEPLKDKFLAFGWDFIRIEGHNCDQLELAMTLQKTRPLAIVADTIKGKGVSFAEDNNEWHYSNLDHGRFKEAIFQNT